MEIGSVYFNTKTNKIVGFVKKEDNIAPATTAISIDPKCEKYYWITPYAYCMNNPVRNVDPDGRVVITMDENARRNIQNTLSKAENKYVKFDKDGMLDTKLLNKSKSMSENMKALKAEANSELKYKYAVTDKDHSGKAFSEKEGDVYRGVTEMPGAEKNPSPDGDIWVLTSSVASEKMQARNTAHEGYSHAFFYENTRNYFDASHHYEWEPSPTKSWFIFNGQKIEDNSLIRVDKNIKLDNRIKVVEQEAIDNYEDSH